MRDEINELSKRARCLAAFAVIVETYDTTAERVAIIRRLLDREIISEMAAELLLETYGPQIKNSPHWRGQTI